MMFVHSFSPLFLAPMSIILIPIFLTGKLLTMAKTMTDWKGEIFFLSDGLPFEIYFF